MAKATHFGLTRTSLPNGLIGPALSGTYRDPEHLLRWNSTLPNAAHRQLKALKDFEDEPCPGVLCRIPATKLNMKLSAKTESKLSSPMCRTATFCDSGGGRPEHMVRTFLLIGDIQKGSRWTQEKEGAKGSGGVTPPPPPPPSRKRQTGNEDGGVAPPTVKAKSGDSPSTGVSVSSRQARYEAARTSLQAMGYTGFHTKTLGAPVAFRI